MLQLERLKIEEETYNIDENIETPDITGDDGLQVHNSKKG